MSKPNFEGTITALVTPFRDGLVDEAALNRLIDLQIEAGVEGLVPVGTTGESPTLNHEEHLRVIECTVNRARNKSLVIAGTGSNSTAEAIHFTRGAQQLGADAALLVAPYYNKPGQEGLYQHFMAIAHSVDIPLILYSIPGRCVIEIHEDTVARLASDAPNIVAIKEAGGSVDRISRLRQVLPDTFTLLSGDDSLTVPFISVGARGVISVASNLVPQAVKGMVDAALAGDFKTAEALHRKYYRLFTRIFVEPNPAPIKALLADRGDISDEVRLPLTTPTEANREMLRTTLRDAGF
ncbi:MAG: 4-hydroxy-tetrahydrodipicolinate synthase [Candidatus Methylacidiphilales bacterium]